MSRTRGARGGLKLNRTLDESPRHRLASLGNPKKKKVSCSFDFRGGGFFLKWKGHFSFWGSARKDIRAVWRGFNSGSGFLKLFFLCCVVIFFVWGFVILQNVCFFFFCLAAGGGGGGGEGPPGASGFLNFRM